MPCSNPRPAVYSSSYVTGESKYKFYSALQKIHRGGDSLSKGVSLMPCGQCLYCRVNQSRQTAVRCMHEASLYSSNSFVTFTFDNESLKKMCPDGSISVKHMQDFMKRLREADARLREKSGLPVRNIRHLYCGEYGGNTNRPHYHALLFNCDFPDKKLYKKRRLASYYNSDFLHSLWPYGYCVIGDVEYASAAYCGRYVTKKITGKKSFDHYQGRQPEFARMSNKPGLGYDWLIQNFKDVYPSDEIVMTNSERAFKMRPPRYYDKILEKLDPEMYLMVKEKRLQRSLEDEPISYSQVLTEGYVFKRKMNNLLRNLEATYDA